MIFGTPNLRNILNTKRLEVQKIPSLFVIEHEKIHVVNVNNGERIETYLIKGERGRGVVCLNGPAARKGEEGDVVIVISYAIMDFEEAKKHKPTVVFPKPGNVL
jgi:aspartate 1-decarboxylase